MLRHLTVQCFVSLPRHDELIQMVTLCQGSLIMTKHNYIYLDTASDTGILRKKKNFQAKRLPSPGDKLTPKTET